MPSIIRSFFSRDLIALKIACVLFVAALIAGHLLLPWQSAFVVSALLSIAMNLTYPAVALVRRQRLWMEVRHIAGSYYFERAGSAANAMGPCCCDRLSRHVGFTKALGTRGCAVRGLVLPWLFRC